MLWIDVSGDVLRHPEMRSFTVFVNPTMGTTVPVSVTEEPRATVGLLGVTVPVKSAGALISKMSVVLCISMPLLPETTGKNRPVEVLSVVEMVSVVVPEPPVICGGEKQALAPLGRFSTRNLTASLNRR